MVNEPGSTRTKPGGRVLPTSQTLRLSAQQLPSRLHHSSHQQLPDAEGPPHAPAQLPPLPRF
jgi:hypothetical protein